MKIISLLLMSLMVSPCLAQEEYWMDVHLKNDIVRSFNVNSVDSVTFSCIDNFSNGGGYFYCQDSLCIILGDGDVIKIPTKDSSTLKKFKRVLFIGDSVTRGLIVDGGNVTEDSLVNYPYFLNQLIPEWQITNAGYSGTTCERWYNSYSDLYDYSLYDLCFVELGYNGYLDGDIESDVLPFLNYEDYHNTEIGYYCKIIDKIHSVNPNAIIVLVASSYFRNNFNYIRLIPILRHYSNLSFVDLTYDEYVNLSDTAYHNTYLDEMGNEVIDFVHFNGAGYKAKAEVVYRKLINILNSSNYDIPDEIYDYRIKGCYYQNNSNLVCDLKELYSNTGKIPLNKGDRVTIYSHTGSGIILVYFVVDNSGNLVKWQLATAMVTNKYEYTSNSEKSYLVGCVANSNKNECKIHIKRNKNVTNRQSTNYQPQIDCR